MVITDTLATYDDLLALDNKLKTHQRQAFAVPGH